MKKLLVLFVFLASLNLVLAAEINVKSTPIKAITLPGGNAIFDLEIENAQSSSDEIKAVILEPNWQRQGGNELYNLNAGQKVKDTLTLFPLGYLSPGVYSINMRFVSTSNPNIFTDHQIVVTVVAYKDVLEAKIETNPQGIDPRKENLVKLNLRSKYNLGFDNLNIHIENSLFAKDIVLSLQGLESKSEEFVVVLNPNTIEGDYDTKILIKYNDNILVDKIEKLKVSAYEDIKETKTEERKFLLKNLIITRTNDGNAASNEVYSLTLAGLNRVFTRFDPEPSKIRDAVTGKRYEWFFTLQPGQSYSILITTNYRIPLLWLIIIVLIGYLSYKYLRTELFIHKRVLLLKSKEGDIAEVKVLLRLKNNGPSIKELHLIDKVPHHLELPHEYMTLKPSSVKKEAHETIISWDIPELIGGEERVISYKLKSKGHKGSLLFSRATCRYKNKLGRISVSRSNQVSI